jgi:hypothetical protein
LRIIATVRRLLPGGNKSLAKNKNAIKLMALLLLPVVTGNGLIDDQHF